MFKAYFYFPCICGKIRCGGEENRKQAKIDSSFQNLQNMERFGLRTSVGRVPREKKYPNQEFIKLLPDRPRQQRNEGICSNSDHISVWTDCWLQWVGTHPRIAVVLDQGCTSFYISCSMRCYLTWINISKARFSQVSQLKSNVKALGEYTGKESWTKPCRIQNILLICV